MAVTRGKKIAGRLNLVMSAMLVFALWIVISLLSTRPGLRVMWDVSPQGQFTVTKGTEDLLADIRARQLKLELITFYQPPRAPVSMLQVQFNKIQERLMRMTTDLLSRYQMLGGDSVEVTHIDILRDIEKTRELLREYHGRQLNNTVMVKLGDRYKILSLTIDLAQIDVPSAAQANVPGADKKPPLLKTYKGEEAVSSAIRSLIVEGTPVVYFLTGFGGPELGGAKANSYSELLSALNDEGFEIRFHSRQQLAQGLPSDATMIVLIEPAYEFDEAETIKVYDYLKAGGRMFLNISYTEDPRDWNPTYSGRGRLGDLLGFRIGTELVCHPQMDPANPGQVQRTSASHLVKNLQVQFKSAHPITRPLEKVQSAPVILNARGIERTESPTGVRVSNQLLVTGPYGWLAPRKRVGGVEETDLSLPQRRELLRSRSIGASIDIDGPDDKMGHLVIVSGLAFLNLGFKERNGDLGLNIFNHLAERSELVTVRGNRYRSKRLQLVPQQLSRIKTLLTGWVPLSLLLMALVVYFFRRRI